MTGNANLINVFLSVAARRPSHPLLVEPDGNVLTYGKLDEWTGRIAAKLGMSGAVPGDRIVVQVDKSPEAVLLYIAVLRAGLVFVPLNTAYTAKEVEYFVRDADPTVVVCRPNVQEQVSQLLADLGKGSLLTLGDDGTGTLMLELPETVRSIERRDPDDLACILYTSGTTGRSKGAMLTHRNLLSNAAALRDAWQWTPDDVLIHILPIYHVHGLFVALHGALLVGATVLFHRVFRPAAVIADFAGATLLMGVPTHYTRLLSESELTSESAKPMRLFISGSAPLLQETHRSFEQRTCFCILERYGMTETGMIASNPYNGERIGGTVGYPLAGVEIRVRDDGGAISTLGEPGVLEVRGPNVFPGYWRNRAKTEEAFTSDGFFKTGDVATQAADGRITLIGRASDLIIAGGLNIYPKEIEQAIDVIPGVVESAVIGVPHPDLGEAAVAVVVAAPGVRDGLSDRISNSLEGRLARFKQPRRIMVVDALPRNAMGKVEKAILRRNYSDVFSDRLQ